MLRPLELVAAALPSLFVAVTLQDSE